MSVRAGRTALVMLGVLTLAVSMMGCTLAGASAAPLTPVMPGEVIGGDIGEVPSDVDTVPTPTPMAPIDVFGTQTAMAPPPEATDDLESTPEPGAEVPAEPGAEVPAEPGEAPAEPAAPAPQPAAPADCPPTHTVQAGENLFRIALRYGLTTQQLASANGITNVDQISVGAVLTIPGCGGAPAAPAPGAAPAAGGTTYTVQPGDNLFRIALRYGLTTQQLASHNGITNPDMLTVGQVLRIP